MSKRITITFTDEQRTELTQLTRSDTNGARTLTRARVLLLADRGQGQARSNQYVAQATGLHYVTVSHLLHRFAAEGLEATLYDKPRPGKALKITLRLPTKTQMMKARTKKARYEYSRLKGRAASVQAIGAD